ARACSGAIGRTRGAWSGDPNGRPSRPMSEWRVPEGNRRCPFQGVAPGVNRLLHLVLSKHKVQFAPAPPPGGGVPSRVPELARVRATGPVTHGAAVRTAVRVASVEGE